MSSQAFCKFNKFGFCKFGKQCFRKHFDEICENVRCKVTDCSLRHPRRCRFFVDYQYCKFGTYCKFLHKANDDDKSIDAIEKQLKDVKLVLNKKEQEIILLNQNIREMKSNIKNEMKQVLEKNDILEKDVKYLKVENEKMKK